MLSAVEVELKPRGVYESALALPNLHRIEDFLVEPDLDEGDKHDHYPHQNDARPLHDTSPSDEDCAPTKVSCGQIAFFLAIARSARSSPKFHPRRARFGILVRITASPLLWNTHSKKPQTVTMATMARTTLITTTPTMKIVLV